MKQWLWIILLLPVSPLVAKDKKLGGYVLDAAAFGEIQSYCVDTHNQPPREVKVINQFLARESRPLDSSPAFPGGGWQHARRGLLTPLCGWNFPIANFQPFSGAAPSTECSSCSGQAHPPPSMKRARC